MPVLYLLGDSTCAQKVSRVRPETGWGECILPYLASGWTVDNRAINGRSTKSFLDEGHFSQLLQAASFGDAAILQFGHNDEKDDALRHTEPWTTYQENLRYMVTALQGKGVAVYLLTPLSRRCFVDGILVDTHAEYPQAMRCVADELSVPCIDMTALTMTWLQELGDEASRQYFLHVDPCENYPDGKRDDTHLCLLGAQAIARMIATELGKKCPASSLLAR